MSIVLAPLLLLAQVGPFGATPLPPTPQMDRANAGVPRTRTVPPVVPLRSAVERSELQRCLTTAKTDPAAAISLATAWRAAAIGSAAADPGECLGFAYTQQSRWAEAEQSFLAARGAAEESDLALRARLGTMAGNAALAGGAAARALVALDLAHSQALAAKDPQTAADIAVDRARALVVLGRPGEAAMALDEARAASPDNGTGWLLSATLARRLKQFELAQQRIEVAARLMPLDPEVGLEAGVIAVLAGREDAARRSWKSVLGMAPGSEAAKLAQGYLDQLGPDPAPSGR